MIIDTCYEEIVHEEDTYVLGNLCLMATHKGLGKKALPILEILKEISPENASYSIIHAIYLDSIEKPQEALAVLDEDEAMNANYSAEDAMVMSLYLLNKIKNYDELVKRGQAYLADNRLQNAGSRHHADILVQNAKRALESA